MTTFLGYARVSDWELRLLERSPSLIARPLTLGEQKARLRRACTTMGVELHDEICTDHAPGGLDACWGLARSDAVARPGQARLRQLLDEHADAAVVLISLDRLSSVVREIEWLLKRASNAPALIALAEGLSTVDAAGLERAADFLDGAASERRARRAAAAPAATWRGRDFEQGECWERFAASIRSRDSLEARRLAGLPHCRPSLSSRVTLARRVRSMRDSGMTLQAIADTLNAERVPTIRGGSKWRRSALQNLVPAAERDLDDLFP